MKTNELDKLQLEQKSAEKHTFIFWAYIIVRISVVVPIFQPIANHRQKSTTADELRPLFRLFRLNTRTHIHTRHMGRLFYQLRSITSQRVCQRRVSREAQLRTRPKQTTDDTYKSSDRIEYVIVIARTMAGSIAPLAISNAVFICGSRLK